MKILFMGTPDFAVPSLEALLAAEDESTRRQAANRFVRCVLAEAAQAGR